MDETQERTDEKEEREFADVIMNSGHMHISSEKQTVRVNFPRTYYSGVSCPRTSYSGVNCAWDDS